MTVDDETNFPHIILLTAREFESLQEDFTRKSSAHQKFPKAQLSKIIGSGGLLGRLDH